MYKLTTLLLFTGAAGFSQSIVGSNNSGSIVSNSYSSGVGMIYVVPASPNETSSGVLGATTQIIFDSLSTEDHIEADGIAYYPNPVQDYLTFETKQEVNLSSMQLFDTKGTLVKLPPVNGNRVDLSSLSTGTYFMSFPNTNIKPIKIVKN